MRLTQVFSDDQESVYSGEVTPLPGCPDVAVSHALFVDGPGGYGKKANKERCEQLTRLGYSAVVCTVCSSNEPQLVILESEGWTKVGHFNNRRTRNTLYFFIKQLKHADGGW